MTTPELCLILSTIAITLFFGGIMIGCLYVLVDMIVDTVKEKFKKG